MARKNTVAEKSDSGGGFEELLAEAESLAEKMEDGGMTLDDSIAAYEKGVGNLRRCADLLRAAEEKVKLLIEKDGAFSLREMEFENGDAEEDSDPDADGEDDE